VGVGVFVGLAASEVSVLVGEGAAAVGLGVELTTTEVSVGSVVLVGVWVDVGLRTTAPPGVGVPLAVVVGVLVATKLAGEDPVAVGSRVSLPLASGAPDGADEPEALSGEPAGVAVGTGPPIRASSVVPASHSPWSKRTSAKTESCIG
jgi:hypothetical protein